MTRRNAFLGLFISLVLTGCADPTDETTVDSPPKITTSRDSGKHEQPKEPSPFRSLVDKKEIIGIWTADDKELLTAKIDRDSIYYVEHFESYPYRLTKDSIFINYPDFLYAGKIGFRKDTLVISSDGEAAFFKNRE